MELEKNLKDFGAGMIEGLKDLWKGATKPSVVGATLGALDAYNYIQAFRSVQFGEKFDNILYAAAGTVALGYGIYAYLTGKWPFTEIVEKEYQPLQWFNESQGRVLVGPGTRWYIPPLEKKVIRNGKVQSISAERLAHECPDFDFRTIDNIDGTIKVQFLYEPADKNGAKEFFWRYRADPSRLDIVIKRALLEEIGKIKGEDLTKKEEYLTKAEERANKILEEELAGVRVTRFSATEPKLSPRSEEILKRKIDAERTAEAEVIRAEGDKKAKIIRAEGEKESTRLKAEATERNTATYLETAKKIAEIKDAEGQSITPVLLYLMDLDNNQEVGESGGTVIKTTGLGQFPFPLPLNIKKK